MCIRDSVGVHHSLDQRMGIRVVDDGRACFLIYSRDQIGDDVCNAAASLYHANQLALIVGNGELPQSSGVPTDDRYQVTGAYIDNLPAHQAATCIDHDVKDVCRRVVHVKAFIQHQGRGDPNGEPAVLLCSVDSEFHLAHGDLVGVVLRVCQELSLVFPRAEVVDSAFKEGCGFRCVFPYLLSAYRINQHGSSLSCLRFRTSLSASNDLLEALHHLRSACLAVTSEPEITALLCVFQEVAEAAIAVPRFTE